MECMTSARARIAACRVGDGASLAATGGPEEVAREAEPLAFC